MKPINQRLGLQQRILPIYRTSFFESLGAACTQGLQIFAGLPRDEEAITPQKYLDHAQLVPALNHHFFNGGLYLLWQDGLLNWLNNWQPEVLILEANPRYLSSRIALHWAHTHHCPLIGWGLGITGSTRVKQIIWRPFLNQFDYLLAYSNQGADGYAACGFDRHKIIVAPNAAVHRPNSRIERSVPFEVKPVVLSVGRLQARKKVDMLIRACAELPEDLQPELWIVGEGPVLSDLQALATLIYPHTRFLGAVHGQDLEPIFKQADIFVLPGTGGLAVQQAMANALPVIVAEADGTQSDLVRPDNGWLVKPGDLYSLKQALTTALSNRQQLREMGQVSFQIVANEINLEKMVEAFAEAINLAAHPNDHSY